VLYAWRTRKAAADARLGLTYALQKDGMMRRMITGPNAVSLVRFEIAVL
jgi:hypothetical protein